MRLSLNAPNKKRVCVCVCVQHDNFSVYVVVAVGGGKQISNPQSNPSSCSDYKSAGALRSNQQEQSAAGTDTLSIRGDHHTVTHALTSTTHTHTHRFMQPAHTLGHDGRYTVCCSSTSLLFSLFPTYEVSKFLFVL